MPTNHQWRSCYNLLSAGQVLSSAHELWVSLPPSLWAPNEHALFLPSLHLSTFTWNEEQPTELGVPGKETAHTKLWRWENTKFIQRTSVLALVPGTEDAGAKTICPSSLPPVWRGGGKICSGGYRRNEEPRQRETKLGWCEGLD